jgi:hypothetical protein
MLKLVLISLLVLLVQSISGKSIEISSYSKVAKHGSNSGSVDAGRPPTENRYEEQTATSDFPLNQILIMFPVDFPLYNCWKISISLVVHSFFSLLILLLLQNGHCERSCGKWTSDGV